MTRAVRSRKARHACHPQPLHNALHQGGPDDDHDHYDDRDDHDDYYHDQDDDCHDHDDGQSWVCVDDLCYLYLDFCDDHLFHHQGNKEI